MISLSALNPQQRRAVETLDGPVLILAGAGTGKTRVITCRVAHLIARGVPPGDILAVTFTNKAAREMQTRVHEMIRPPRRVVPAATQSQMSPPPAEAAARPIICTFHSLGVRILRQHIEKLGYKRNFVIYDESDQLGVIRKILSQVSARGEKTEPAAILGVLSRYRNAGPNARPWGDPGVRALAEHLRGRYEAALRAANAVDFDDLILLPLRLFREYPDVLATCRTRYRYIMVDEYQDTNAAQFQLVHALAAEHRNLCVVGDDDQSIYGWRGAELANLLELERYFPEVKIIKLEQNYRSPATILAAANALIRHNVRRRPKQLWSQLGPGEKITVRGCADEDAEARAVVEQIEWLRRAHRVPWADHAVLFRTNQQSRPLETALRAAGVRYRVVGGQSFFDRREIRDFLAYLKTFLNPHDDISLLRIANTPARGLSDATLTRLLAASQTRHASVFDTMKNPAVSATLPRAAQESVAAFVALVEHTRTGLQTDTGSLADWAEQFLQATGYLDAVRRGEKDREAGELRVRGVRELVGSMDTLAPAPGRLTNRLERFLDEVTLDTERESEADAGHGVTLITMHSCKGLEFPHVHIVGLEDGLLPHARARDEGTLDEERRLFYVSVTRAMRTLALSYCTARKQHGRRVATRPSPFLQELPAELLEWEDAKPAHPVSPTAGKSLFAAMRAAVEETEPAAGRPTTT